MWPGFDPELLRGLATIREMVSHQHQAPTREWPLVYVTDSALLVVREWPDGSVTAYVAQHLRVDLISSPSSVSRSPNPVIRSAARSSLP
jgi:hypothetical protein